jgi:signal transduction histidine kinase
VWITVRDNGSGMSQATLARIFDPFFTTKPQDEGTGLGLSVSLGIVQRHGGRLSVESAPGEGTTFKLSLPIESAAATGETSHDAL